MPLASGLSRANVPGWLHSGVARIALEWRSLRIGLSRLVTEGVFRIAGLRPDRHREVLQFFPYQTQFGDDLSGYLIFHIGPFTFYIARGAKVFSSKPTVLGHQG